MNTQRPTPVAVTGDRQTDAAIAKWIKGTEDRLTVEIMISQRMDWGLIPKIDDQGRDWTPEMIMEYAIFIGA